MGGRLRLLLHPDTRAYPVGDFPNGTILDIDGVQHHAQNGYFGGNGKTYAFQRDEARGLDRFETRDGDEWPGDAGRDNARSEITPDEGSAVLGNAYWVAYDVLVDSPAKSGGGVFGQLHKLHSDDTPSSPIISFEFASPTGSAPGQIRLKYSWSTADMDAGPSQPKTDVTAFVGPYPAYGRPLRLVIRYLHTAIVTGGSLEAWLDGEKIVDLPDIPLGYLDTGAPYWKRGVYRSQSPQTIIAYYSKWVGPTTVSQLDRVTNPLPFPYVPLTPATITITTTSLPTPVDGVPYTATVEAAGGGGDRVWTVDSGDVPPGLLFSDGEFSGMAAPGNYTFSLRVTDPSGTDVQNFSWSIPFNFAFATQGLAPFYVGTQSTAPIATTGGSGPVTLSAPAAALPAGFSLSNTGLTVNAAAPGNYNIPITATSGGVSISKTYPVSVVAALAFTKSALPVPVIGKAYSAPITTTGGVAPVSVALTAGILPPGLQYTGGAVAGTATAAGTYDFGFTATDTAGTVKTISYRLVISADLTVSTASLGAIQEGVAFSRQLVTSGGAGTKHFLKTGGSSFIAVSDAGVVTSTLHTSGAYTLTGTVTDDIDSANFSYSGTVSAAPTQTFDNNWADGIGVTGTANVAAWDAWVGDNQSGVLVTLPWDQAFSGVQTAWNTAVTAMKTRTGRVDFEVPLAAFNGTGGFTLAAVGAGTLDAAWTAMIDNAIANGLADAGLVLGPRFNNNPLYVPWGCMGNEAAYITAYNRFASIAMSRPGAAFKLKWAPSTGFHAAPATPSVMYDPANAYPGDTYVHEVGLMVRAQEWGTSRTKEVAWGTILNGPSGNGLACLTWLYTFAKNHAKAMCIPAWNTSFTATDGSGYPDADGAWITGQFIDWWNASPDDVQITGGNWEQLTGGVLGDDSRPLTEIEFSEAAGFVDRTALRITNSAPPSGTVGGAFNYTYVIAGGTAPYTYGHTGSYPTGTSRTNATVSGTLTAAGGFTSTFTVTDALGATASKTYTVAIAATSTNYFARNFGWYPRAGAVNGRDFLVGVIEPQYGKAVWVSNNMPEHGNYANQTGTLSFHMDQYTGANTRNLVIGLSLVMGGEQASWTYNSLRNNPTQLAAFRQFRSNVISILTSRHNSNPNQQIVLRDWERNGNWYPANSNYNSGNRLDYIWCFQDFYGPIKAACPWVLVEWNTNHGSTATVSASTIKSYYPGNAYVDIIGTDSYNEQSGYTFAAWLGNGTSDWEALDSYNFAVANDKFWSVTETGTGRKNPPNGSINPGDNSAWLGAVADWCNATVGARLHHFCYFDISAAGNWETSMVWENTQYATTPPIAKPNARTTLKAKLAA